MWTLGYDDDGGEFCFSEPFHGAGRKLRPLVPRPMLSLRVNGGNFSSSQYYHHLANFLTEESKRELLLNNDNSTSSCPPVVVSSSRWNPTVEQLRILEELYRRGTRTPSAEQIQHITAQLRRYGKIEGKNVFYWFQNHKARERQKRRRQSAAEESKYSETEKVYEIEDQTKTNCSWRRPPSKISQECAKTQRRTELEEEEEIKRDGTWNKYSTLNCQLMINPTRNAQHLNDVVEPRNGDQRRVGSGGEYSETTTTLLQLFPLRSSVEFCKYEEEEEEEGRRRRRRDIVSDSEMMMIKSSTFSPSSCSFQFFEFLPLKN